MSSMDPAAEIDRLMGLSGIAEGLGGAGDNPTPGAPPNDPLPQGTVQNTAVNEHGGNAPGGQLSPEVIALRDQLEAQSRQIEELKAQRTPLPSETGTAPPQPQQPFNYEQAKKQLEDNFIKDPGGTLLWAMAQIAQNNQATIQAEIAKATGGIASDVSGGNIDAFEAKMQADPVLAPALPRFKELVAQARKDGTLAPGNMQSQLDALASNALGDTIRKRPANGRTNAPPAWGATGSMSSADSGQRTATQQSGLTAEQQEYVRTMMELGVDKTVIAERLKNWNDEGGIAKQ